MIKYFGHGDKERVKKVLKKVYKCPDVDKMSDDELVFCLIAKTLEGFDYFCGIVKSAETELASRILKIEKALKSAKSFDEFKAFCLEGSDE
ncbi:hypothetical protein [Campylobacter sp.]|uniref:hypothetical protein n=1 Tax=Campylobacter sp. TaxID=205 RepID=UPI002A7FE9A0|nr:hypothetical protein [Campylobacter sp.]MDY4444817.1 hypothetical protein [Campylobacter sp.]